MLQPYREKEMLEKCMKPDQAIISKPWCEEADKNVNNVNKKGITERI